jgi:hypothetical protein
VILLHAGNPRVGRQPIGGGDVNPCGSAIEGEFGMEVDWMYWNDVQDYKEEGEEMW